MAGTQVTVTNTAVENQRRGYNGIALTNYNATTEPEIGAGSKVEINGALFTFTSAESITAWASVDTSTWGYILLTTASTEVTASYTATTGTWSDSKGGYYVGNNRVIGKVYKTGATTYSNKYIIAEKDISGLTRLNQLEVGTALDYYQSGVKKFEINSSGNVGLFGGAADIEAWNPNYPAIEFLNTAIMVSNLAGQYYIYRLSNCYTDVSGYWKYKNASSAFMDVMSNIDYTINSAGSGSADAVITWTPRFLVTNADELKIGGGAGGSNRDSYVYFASDASLFWDESEDEIVINKQIKPTAIDCCTTDSLITILSITGTATTSFKILKPIQIYISGGTCSIYTLPYYYVFQNNSNISLALNPSSYNLVTGALTTNVACTGIYGLTSYTTSEIITLT